jgi:hypothetical protein
MGKLAIQGGSKTDNKVTQIQLNKISYDIKPNKDTKMIYRAEEKGVLGIDRPSQIRGHKNATKFRVTADDTMRKLETSNGKNQRLLVYTLS